MSEPTSDPTCSTVGAVGGRMGSVLQRTGGARRRSRRDPRLPYPPRRSYVLEMTEPDLNPDELAAVTRALRDTIATDRYPLSRRICNLKSALAKLDPQPVVEPLPPPNNKAWVNSTLGQRKRRQ